MVLGYLDSRLRCFAGVVLLFCLGLLLQAPMASLASAGELSYSGSSSIGDHLLPVVIKAFTQKTGFVFGRVNATSSDDGFAAVRDGKALIGGLSRFQTPQELEAGLGNQVIGYDAVVVYVHPENPVQSLSLSEVKDIFSGNITNWKEVGGTDGPIMVILKDAIEGGTYGQFQALALGGEPFAKPALTFPGHKENIDYVAGNPLGITLGSLAFDENVARILAIDKVQPSRIALNQGLYPLARPYILVYRENPENKALAAFLKFVFSPAGQRIVSRFAVPVLEFTDE